MEQHIGLLICAGAGFGLNILITPLILRLSKKYNLYDHSNNRKIHTGDISRLGGIGILLSFFGSILLLYGINSIVPIPGSTFLVSKELLFFVSGLIIIHFIGLLDDFWNLSPLYKLIGQILAAAIVVAGGLQINTILLPYVWCSIDLGWTAVPITMFWLVGLANAVNLVDGLDGLAGGISGIAALALGLFFLLQGQALPSLMSFALVGSVAAFLVFNFPPARIFMGDSGALFLGFFVGAVPLLFQPGETTTFSLLVPITMLIIPILDTAAAIVRRISRKKSIGSADREHFHHKLLELGFSVKKILVLVYILSIGLLLLAVLTTNLERNLFFSLLLSAWFGFGLFFYWLHRRIHRPQNS
ncbi:MAG: undecaprenyl/decaprenyl-phosphate alpha-N-acetylglucosaminyl 1-phosphate transferase [Spirochaetales bacterium]|nr:undecaprenyl/decaprenyl-phosphate alpha-N-acetylglucosaminyl 1-phosphate transferase [Spirochaetales bacterium]MCF7937313.1 undecaprenyl/decaprenyl-phosphate alpha-N-acetylglucosaminyl 1-phosphate transferase [Spirochaetales bacterium]